MKIVSIFENRLYAFHFHDEAYNELQRIIKCWFDSDYMLKFFEQHCFDLPAMKTQLQMLDDLSNDAFEMITSLLNIAQNKNEHLSVFFKPLNNFEYYNVQLSKQKSKKRYLRIYAIKIDADCFVITGGAIKFHNLNKDRMHTQIEMTKMSLCGDYLKSVGVFDSISFCEFLNESI